MTLVKLRHSYVYRPFGPNLPLLTLSETLPLTPTILPCLTPMSIPQPLLYTVNICVHRHQKPHCPTCTAHKRSAPISLALRYNADRASSAIRVCMASVDPRCLRSRLAREVSACSTTSRNEDVYHRREPETMKARATNLVSKLIVTKRAKSHKHHGPR